MFVLFQSIKKYRDSMYGFFPFFSKNLQNKLISIYNIKKKNKIYILNNEEMLLEPERKDASLYKDDNVFSNLTRLEKAIINMRFIEKASIKEVADSFHLTESQVYYFIKKIRIKLRNNMNGNYDDVF